MKRLIWFPLERGFAFSATVARILLLLALITPIYAACGPKKAGIYIEVDGERLSEETLRENRPEVYKSIRRDYDARLQEALQRLATDRLFELEAKERKLENSSEYIKFLRSGIPQPQESEIMAYYERTKGSGQAAPYPQVRGSLLARLQNERFQEIFQAEVGRLQKKYSYNEYSGEVERQEVDIAEEPVRGNAQGQLLIVEFSGYECPFCKRSQATAKALQSKYKEIKWVFKDYPLRTNRLDAHLAANCVYSLEKGKFWDFFDDLYSPSHDRSYLEKASLRQAVQRMGVDLQEYDACIEDDAIKDEILDDHAEGVALGVRGIPAFFINGRLLEGAQPLQNFERIIEQEL